VSLIFVALLFYDNILTTKLSQITVLIPPLYNLKVNAVHKFVGLLTAEVEQLQSRHYLPC